MPAPDGKTPPYGGGSEQVLSLYFETTLYSFLSKELAAPHWGHFRGLHRPSFSPPHSLQINTAIDLTPLLAFVFCSLDSNRRTPFYDRKQHIPASGSGNPDPFVLNKAG